LRIADQTERVGLDSVDCPKCNFTILFLRGHDAFFDECGFESYSLACDGCGARFFAMVDPSDGAMISQIED
jgi:DNA-directed RNA polymerase subunit RPC12/RpoP